MPPDLELGTIPAVVKSTVPRQSTVPDTDPQQEKISAQAYYIWQQEGCPTGRSFEHWLLAEAQLQTQGTEADTTVPFVKPANPTPRQARRRLLDLIAMI